MNSQINKNDVAIGYLADHQALVPEVTDLIYSQWADLFHASGTSKHELQAMIAERAVTHQLPIAIVALRNGKLVGTGSIKLAEPGTKVGLSPWLAGMYVKETHRGSGIGALLVSALEAKAHDLGVKTLYLSAGASESLYARLGWRVLERVNSYGVKAVALMAKDLHPDVAKG